ncbi:hypothetical protein [Xenorhabdus sp. BG5]|nr:hypothetical protein [Xenorhabdus sp. BG5]MBE8597074.1 hypothetical protein [Xenorhabdus sp. BG5]
MSFQLTTKVEHRVIFTNHIFRAFVFEADKMQTNMLNAIPDMFNEC